MSNMWRFMATDSAEFRRITPPSTSLLSVTRSVSCLILMILITSILTVASVYEHFTNICIGLLLILMMFFIVFSITMIKTSLLRNDEMQPAGMSDSIWTTIADIRNIQIHIDEAILKDPPNYDSVMRDSKYLYPSPPSYASVVCSSSNAMVHKPTRKSIDATDTNSNDSVIISVTKLTECCEA